MNWRKYFSNVRDVEFDDVLKVVGLQKRSASDWVFPMLAGFGAGLAVGAGLAFFLTPYRGDEARKKVAQGAADAQKLLTEKVATLTDKVSSLVGDETSNGNAGAQASSSAQPPRATVNTNVPNRTY